MNFEELISRSTFLTELRDKDQEFLSSVATELSVPAGTVVMREGEAADRFFIVANGKVGLEVVSEGRAPVVIETLGTGDLLGISWLFPPFYWAWTARAVTDATLASFDALEVRERAEIDRELRERLLELIGRASIRRLQATRLQLLNLYETSP